MNSSQMQSPPDMRIAKAFKFNIEDLNANREGILSIRQRGLSDWFAYQIISRIRQLPIIGQVLTPTSSAKKTSRPVKSICGRIKLEHYIVDRRLDRSAVFYEYYHMVFTGHDRFFRVSRPQYDVLSENLKYRVYYQQLGEERQILSIERIIGSCDDHNKSTN